MEQKRVEALDDRLLRYCPPRFIHLIEIIKSPGNNRTEPPRQRQIGPDGGAGKIYQPDEGKGLVNSQPQRPRGNGYPSERYKDPSNWGKEIEQGYGDEHDKRGEDPYFFSRKGRGDKKGTYLDNLKQQAVLK